MKLKEYINKNDLLSKIVFAFGEVIPDPSIFLSEELTDIEVMDLDTIESCKYCQKSILEYLQGKNLSKRALWHYGNVLSIFSKFLSTLTNQQLPNKRIEKSWIARFFDLCKECDNENIQEIWAKLLSKELLQEGHVFKRTLAVLDNMEKFEYEWFVEFCRFTIDNSYVFQYILYDNKYYPFNKFQTLIDCGLLNSTQGVIRFDKSESIKAKGYTLNLSINTEDYQGNIYTLTDAGTQLCELIEVKASREYLYQLKDIIGNSRKATLEIIED